MKSRIRSVLVSLLAIALLVAGLPGASAQTTGYALTLSGPASAFVGEPATYSGTLTLDGAGLSNESVDVLVDGVVATTVTSATDGSYAAPLTFTTTGPRSLQAVAFAGTAQEIRSDPLAVTVYPVREITLDGPVQAAVDEPENYSGRLLDHNEPVAAAEVRIFLDGTVAKTVTTDTDGRYTAAITFVTSGPYKLEAVAFAGTATETRSLIVTVEVAPRQISTVTLTGPTDGNVGQSRTYTGTLMKGENPLANKEIKVSLDGAVVTTTTTALDGSFSATVTASSAGAHYVQAVAFSGLAVESSSEIVRVDAVPASNAMVPADIAEAADDLYTGTNPVQQGVAAGTIQPEEVAVIQGAVTTEAGAPIAGVDISVPDNPEFGHTDTATDASFDMAVNGGEDIVVRYEKAGYLPVEREIDTSTRDYEREQPVVLTPLDSAVTTVDLGTSATQMQVAEGTEITDADGTRSATLMFEPATEATMVMPDGSTQAVDNVEVRATEFTAGETGLASMPGELPGASAYTYAVEYSLDEALAAGSDEVRFSKPVATYTENFLEFPVGTDVPAAYYDRDQHQWVPSEDGVVVKIVSIVDGKANLDTDGDGNPDSAEVLAALGVTDAELVKLASLHAPGTTLWRVEITHFTPWDFNHAWGLFAGAIGPEMFAAFTQTVNDGCKIGGSIIGCENQTLGESVPLAGTPFSLAYDTSRMPGYRGANTLDIPLTEGQLPPGLRRVTLEVTVAGRKFAHEFEASPNLSYSFTWDGKDASGQLLNGTQPATIRIGYVYGTVYYNSRDEWERSFGQIGTTPFEGNESRREVTLFQDYETRIGAVVAPAAFDLGGWSLSEHHVYDAENQTVYLGDGDTRSVIGDTLAFTTVAGNGKAGASGEGTYSGDGASARDAGLGEVTGIAMNGAGVLFIVDSTNGVIRRVARDGTISTFAGGGSPPGNGDGGVATQAEFEFPTDVALGPDRSVYVLDSGSGDVRRIAPDGTISTFVGGGVDGLGDGGRARDAELYAPKGIAVGPQGTVYIADTGHNRVRKINPDGTITTVAGGANPADGVGDGLPATSARLLRPTDVAVAADGTLYIAESAATRIRKVTPEGTISTIAGNGLSGTWNEGDKALSASIARPISIAIDPATGDVCFIERGRHRVARITPDGHLVPAAGTGEAGFSGDGGIAINAKLHRPRGVAFTTDGHLMVADTDNFRVRMMTLTLPGYSSTNVKVPSEDGSEVYEFNQDGRHLRTLDGLTGAMLYRFNYDSAGRLTSVEDSYANITTIERDTAGTPTAIVSPFGVRTALTVGASGYVTRIENAAAEATTMTYRDGGLLETFTTPRATHRFTYDSIGRLILDEGPNGKSTSLARRSIPGGFEVTTTSAEGLTTTYRTEQLDDGSVRRTVTDPSGGVTTSLVQLDGTVVTTTPDDMRTEVQTAPDPRWGLAVPLMSSLTTTTPAGKSVTTTAARQVTLSNPSDPLTLTSQTDTVTSNGKTTKQVFDATAKTITTTTAANRQSVTTLNDKARVASVQPEALAPVSYRYDLRGRVDQVTHGTGTDARTSTLGYDASGFVNAVTDPRQTTTGFTNDAVGRVTSTALPGLSTIGFGYDADGNLTSLTPPGRAAHSFTRKEAGLLEAYTAPDLGDTTPRTTTHTYDRDYRPDAVALPGPRSIDLSYDTSGRLAKTTVGRGDTTYTYRGNTSRLEKVAAPGNETTSFDYDGSLVTAVTSTGTSAGSIAYGYDSDLRVSSGTVAGSAAVSYTYDNDGLVKTAGALTLGWDASAALLTSTTAGTVTTTHDYNVFGEAISDSYSAGTTSLYGATYTRDALGRIATKAETIGGVTTNYAHTYDDRGRLTDVTKDGAAWRSYGYDANGNRTSATQDGVVSVGVYDAQDRMTTYGDASYTYNAMGQLTSKTVGTETTTYEYDELGNLLKVVLPNKTIEYVVDGLGRRIARKVDGQITDRWVYGQGILPVAELEASGSGIESRFVYATRSHVPDLMVKNGTTYRFVTDQVGSVRMVVNTSDGSVAQRIDYDPFGKVFNDTNPGFQPFGFGGGLYDPETKLVRFGERDYEPRTGRWTTKDPIGFDGGDTNLYGFVMRDPINRVDPAGLSTEGYCIGILAAGEMEQFCIVRDDTGGVGFSTSTGSGEQVPAGIGISVQKQWTNQQRIHDVEGKFDYGGFAAGPLRPLPGVSADLFAGCPFEGAWPLLGAEVGPSIGVPPAEVHWGRGDTTVRGFNPREMAREGARQIIDRLNPFD